MASRIRQHDWAATALGPASLWPDGLRSAVDMMLGCGFASAIVFPREALLLGNDAWVRLLGEPSSEGFALEPGAGVWAALGPQLERARRGETATAHGVRLPARGQGVVEAGGRGAEVTTSVSVSPVRSGGEVSGVWVVVAPAGEPGVAEAGGPGREAARRGEGPAPTMSCDDLVAVVSHELRTPLSSILIWAKMLRAGQVRQRDVARALAVIESSAEAQRQVVDALLDDERLLTGKVHLSPALAELGPVLEQAAAAVRPAAEAKGLSLAIDPGQGPLFAMLDRDRLGQALFALLSNAVKFTPAGGRVEAKLARRGQAAVIEVSDTGEGVDPALLPCLFGRFWQASSGTTRQHGGLGLGLSIARRLVELHGGTLEASSEGPGRGATFTLSLPAHAAAEARPEPGQPASMRQLEGVRVLLVEDDPPTREVLEVLLEQGGAQVTAAASAAEALSTLDEGGGRGPGMPPRFDALVSDIGLPGRDGCVLLAEVRRRASGASLPALALTASKRDDDRRRALAAGFAAYLSKPVEPRVLITTLARLVSAPT